MRFLTDGLIVLKTSGEMLHENFTVPNIVMGKKCKTKAEQASQKWYVEFTVNDKRQRISKGYNKLSNYTDKLEAFEKLKTSIYEDLKNGTYGVEVPKPVIIPSIKDAIKQFVKWHNDKGSRPKTIQSYSSKLKYLSDAMGNIAINYAYTKDISDLLIVLQNDNKWSNKTFNNCKLIFSGLFQYGIECQYITNNPVSRIKSKFVGKSDRNKAFSKKDFQLILNEVEKDTMLSMFVKSIYYTCIRPMELSKLQIKHIDFNKRTIFIPASISKNKKDGYVHIDDNYYKLLEEYYYNAPSDNYLFCNDTVLFGTVPYQPNRPYKRFVKILDKLNMNAKGYTLYSTKHYSNVQKFLGGWTVAEIMKANRHASIEETENYLRDLLDYVDITKKVVPAL